MGVDDEGHSLGFHIMAMLFALFLTTAIAGPLTFDVFMAAETSDTFEECTALVETSCDEVVLESEQASISKVERSLFEIEQIDFESMVYAVTVPDDWTKDYVVVEYTIYTDAGQRLEQSREVIPASSDLSETGQIELSEEHAELGREITLEVVGGGDGIWADDYEE